MAGTRTYAPQPWTIPTRWLNTIFGIFLLPVAVLLTQSLFTCFHQATVGVSGDSHSTFIRRSLRSKAGSELPLTPDPSPRKGARGETRGCAAFH